MKLPTCIRYNGIAVTTVSCMVITNDNVVRECIGNLLLRVRSSDPHRKLVVTS